MKKSVKIISVIGVLVIGLLVAGIAILKSIDFNQYKGLIAEQAKAATGRDLKIAGDLNLEISLTPRVAVNGVSFSNAAWGSRPEMVTVKRFFAEVSLMPLLSGQIKVNRVVLEGVDLLAEKNKAGQANWEIGGPATAEQPKTESGGEVTLPEINNVSVKDVKITYKDAQAGQEYTLALDSVDLSADGVDAPLKLNVKGSVNGEAFSVGGHVGSISGLSGGGMFPLKLDIAALGAKIGLDGKVGVSGGKPAADLKLAVDGVSLAGTLKAAAALAPAAGEVKLPISGAYKVSTRIKLDGPTKIALTGLEAGVGALSVSGRVAADLGGKRPALDVALTTDTLNLDELLAKGDKPAAPAPTKEATGDGRVFPNDPLPLDGLKAADAKVSFDANKVIVQGIEIVNVKLGIDLKNGRLRVTPLAAGVAGGKIDGDVTLDGSIATPTLKAKLAAAGIDYGMLLEQRGLTDIAQGKVDLDVDVAGSGGSVRKLMAGLNGKTRVVTQNGQLKSGALNIFSTDLTSVLNSKDDKKIICGVVDFDIVKGMANVRSIVAETGGISVVGTGSANLADETLKLCIDPRSKRANLATAAMVPINVNGTFAKPGVEIDAAAAAGNVAAGAARIGTAIATGGLSLLVEKVAKETVAKTDNTDYCTPALAGKKVVPGEMTEAKSTAKTPAGEAQPTPKKDGGSTLDNLGKGIGSGLKSLFGN